MPLDPDPHPDGNVVLVTLDDGAIRGRVLTGDELPAQQTAYVRHDRTCARSPQAARLREQLQQQQDVPQPLCACHCYYCCGWR